MNCGVCCVVRHKEVSVDLKRSTVETDLRCKSLSCPENKPVRTDELKTVLICWVSSLLHVSNATPKQR